MKTYTVNGLEKILQHYPHVKSLLDGQGQAVQSDGAVHGPTPPPPTPREVPLGWRPTDREPWPLAEPRHAKQPFDGKAKARQVEELHVACLDVERAMAARDRDGYPLVSDDDAVLIYRRYVFGWGLDELAAEHGYSDRASMHNRCRRAVRRLLLVIDPAAEKRPRRRAARA